MEFLGNFFKKKAQQRPDLSDAAAKEAQLQASNIAYEQGDYEHPLPEKTVTDSMKQLQNDLQKGPPEDKPQD